MSSQLPAEDVSNYPRRTGEEMPGNHPHNLLLLQKVGVANTVVALMFQALWIIKYFGVISNVFSGYYWLFPLTVALVGSIPIVGLARDGRWSFWKTICALLTPLADYFPLAGLLLITALQDIVVAEADRFGVRRSGRKLRVEDFALPRTQALEPADSD